MKLTHDKDATKGVWSSFRSGVAALARRTSTYLRMPLLAAAVRASHGTAALPGTARRSGAPPFADTEASWHHL